MNYFEIPDKEFEEFCKRKIDELGLSVRTYGVLKRCGCDTIAEAAYLTEEDILKVKSASQRAVDEVQEKLAEQNLSLMTQEEKQKFLRETDNLVILRRKIRTLELREKRNKEQIRRQARGTNDEWNRIKKNRDRALKEARGIVHTSRYPVARLLESMYFGQSALEGSSVCAIFELWEEHCFLEDDTQEGENADQSCEECIETFLADYYWGKRMAAKLAEERGKAPKMMRLRLVGSELSGRCPACKQLHHYSRQEHYCFRCGTFLNWDEENWDEEIRRQLDCLDEDEEEDE